MSHNPYEPMGTQPPQGPYRNPSGYNGYADYAEPQAASPGPEYGNQPYPPQQPYQAQQPYPAQQPRSRRDGAGQWRTALCIQTLGDIAAGFLALWIVLYFLGANQGNGFVDFVHGIADWLAGWSQDIFTMSSESLRTLLDYGLAGIIYLALGHGIGTWIRRL